MVLAITAQEFEVTDAYHEWELSHTRPTHIKTVNGERAYQISLGTARASGGFPARVTLAGVR